MSTVQTTSNADVSRSSNSQFSTESESVIGGCSHCAIDIKPLHLPRIVVRKAQLQDLAAIVSMNSQMSSELDKKDLNPNCVERMVRSQIMDQREGTYFVASINGCPAGMLRIWPEPYDWDGKDIWWIDNVFTEDRVRKQGVGTALMHYVMDVARTSDSVKKLRLHVHIHNFNAIGFYLKFGFEIRDFMLSQSI